MNNLGVLGKSLKHLADNPKLFLPRIISSLISSAFLIVFLSKFAAGTRMSTSMIAASFLGLFLLSCTGIFVWLMLVSMVKNGSGLKKGFVEAAQNIAKVLKTGLMFLLLAILISLPSSAGILLYTQGTTLGILIGPLISILLVFLLSYTSYFMPVTLLETEGVLESWRKSYSGSKEKRKTVMALTLLSFVLLGSSLWFTSSPVVKSLGQAGFILGRLLSSVVTTYVMVLSPELYLD